jgi:phosphoribosylglycinamide formyltransferase 2
MTPPSRIHLDPSVRLGAPTKPGGCKVLLLGSGELGKELVIELQRLGVEVVACDSYADAPAMQVAHRARVFDMRDPGALRAVVESEAPDLIVPEIEAIATEELVVLEREGHIVVPTAEAARLTMDREGIRRLASEELGLPTARSLFASDYDAFVVAARALGWPCVVKPLMSSSGKGQSVVRGEEDLARAWELSQTAGRAGAGRVIVEEFIRFESEITLLTVRARTGTWFCDPIGHLQKEGDYVESWQPHPMEAPQLERARHIARAITDRLGGYGLFGVELFLLADGGVLFSEVSPRPHDTGLVTLATQELSEFALHARAILSLPVGPIHRHRVGASAALRAPSSLAAPVFTGLGAALSDAQVSVRLFGKPVARPGRRMGVALAWDADIAGARARACRARESLGLEEG